MRKMRKKMIVGAAMAVMLALAGYAYASRSAACPGKIVCPLTGKVICANACPAK